MADKTPEHVIRTLKFVNDAAHLLAFTAPETSAHLMSHRNALMLTHETLPSDAQREHVCGCCGHIMVIGHGCSLKVTRVGTFHTKRRSGAKKARDEHVRKAPTLSSMSKIITCACCKRDTVFQMSAPPRIKRKTIAPAFLQGKACAALTSASAVAQPTRSKKTNANFSSKKRAKSRRAGLQALLSQSNAVEGNVQSGRSTSRFLRLTDFLKND